MKLTEGMERVPYPDIHRGYYSDCHLCLKESIRFRIAFGDLDSVRARMTEHLVETHDWVEETSLPGNPAEWLAELGTK